MSTRTRLDGLLSHRKPHGELRDGKPRPLYERINIDPAQNVILGSRNIARYLGVSSLNTIFEWMELYAFPVIKRPDGLYMTTMTAIDQWIFIAADIVMEQKAAGVLKSKGHIRIAAKRAAAGTGLIEPSDYRKRRGTTHYEPSPSPGPAERARLKALAEAQPEPSNVSNTEHTHEHK